MSADPSLVELPATTIVGLRVRATFQDLFTAVPAAWRQVLNEPDAFIDRLDEGFVDCSLGSNDGVYTELIGARMPAGAIVPGGYELATLPAARYASLTHFGPLETIAGSFGRLEEWIAALPPDASARRWTHDGVKLDIGYLPDAAETRPGREGHRLYARVRLS